MGQRLGQHFLFDPGILARIADAAGATAPDAVLEIGPGKGTLTKHLASRAGSVVAIEKDRRLAAALRETFAASNVTIVEGDALKVEWPVADVIAGNIPYQITSPLIERALTPPLPARIVFLIQREVADRLAAAPGTADYGALSAGVQLVAKVERLFTVKAGSFSPPPRVESAVIRITPGDRRPATIDDFRPARTLIRLAFQRRRQQLQRTLKEMYGLSAEEAAKSLSALGLDVRVRPEELAPSQFRELARSLPRI